MITLTLSIIYLHLFIMQQRKGRSFDEVKKDSNKKKSDKKMFTIHQIKKYLKLTLHSHISILIRILLNFDMIWNPRAKLSHFIKSIFKLILRSWYSLADFGENSFWDCWKKRYSKKDIGGKIYRKNNKERIAQKELTMDNYQERITQRDTYTDVHHEVNKQRFKQQSDIYKKTYTLGQKKDTKIEKGKRNRERKTKKEKQRRKNRMGRIYRE